MDRTFALVFWIQIFTVITPLEGGIPLSLRCTSRPALSTFSRSTGSPFLAAEPHLSFLSTDLPPLILDKDAEETPECPEKLPKTIVILHKLNKNDDSDIEIIITTKQRQETNEDSSKSNESDVNIDKSTEDRDNEESLTVPEPIYNEEITKDVNYTEEDKKHTTTETVDAEKTVEVQRNDVEDKSIEDKTNE